MSPFSQPDVELRELTRSLVDLQQQAKRSGDRLLALTWVLVVLTLAVVALTVVLVVRG